MAEQVLKNIYCIKVPLPNNPLKNINCYLIKGTTRNLLIDTGFNKPICCDALRNGLAELDVTMENTDIFLTHMHADHSGLASLIAEQTTKIYISEVDRILLTTALTPEHRKYMREKYLLYGMSKSEIDENRTRNPASIYLPMKHANYIGVEDGFEMNLGSSVLRCIATPGHTPGHMCVYDEQRKILFSGDHILFDITPNITAWKDLEDSLGKYIQSLDKIKKLEVDVTLAAHRNHAGDIYARIGELQAHHKERLDEVYNIVSSTERVTTYETAAQMTWSIRAKNWGEFPLQQKWFAVGEASAHLEYLFCRGNIIKKMDDGKCYYSRS